PLLSHQLPLRGRRIAHRPRRRQRGHEDRHRRRLLPDQLPLRGRACAALVDSTPGDPPWGELSSSFLSFSFLPFSFLPPPSPPTTRSSSTRPPTVPTRIPATASVRRRKENARCARRSWSRTTWRQ